MLIHINKITNNVKYHFLPDLSFLVPDHRGRTSCGGRWMERERFYAHCILRCASRGAENQLAADRLTMNLVTY